MTNINFKSVVIIGLGLIGSSLARAIKEKEVSKTIYGIDTNEENIKKCLNLKIISKGKKNLEDLKEQTDLIIICSPNCVRLVTSPEGKITPDIPVFPPLTIEILFSIALNFD